VPADMPASRPRMGVLETSMEYLKDVSMLGGNTGVHKPHDRHGRMCARTERPRRRATAQLP
jgi:hypothetical protein